MLFRSETLQQIRAGTVSLAFRRWHQARVREGSRLRTAIGVVEVIAVTEIPDAQVCDAPRAGYPSADAVRADFSPGAGRMLFRIEIRYCGPDPRLSVREQPVAPDNWRRWWHGSTLGRERTARPLDASDAAADRRAPGSTGGGSGTTRRLRDHACLQAGRAS